MSIDSTRMHTIRGYKLSLLTLKDSASILVGVGIPYPGFIKQSLSELIVPKQIAATTTVTIESTVSAMPCLRTNFCVVLLMADGYVNN